MAQELESLVFRLVLDDKGRLQLQRLNATMAQTERTGKRATRSLRSGFGGFGATIKGLLPILGVSAGLAGAMLLIRRTISGVVNQIKQAISVSREFGAVMSRVGAIARPTSQGMKELRNAAKELGATTIFTARQVAETQFILAKAGFNTNEILGALRPTLDLAAAGQLEMAEAAGIAADVMRGMGKDVSELTHLMDVMTAAATSSNQTIQDIGEAMKFAAPSAKLAGLEFEEMSAALAILANRGIRASIAGTGLRRSIAIMLGDLSEGEKGVGELGRQLINADGSMVSLARAMEIMRAAGIKAFDSFSIFGARAGNIMAILQDVGPETLRLITERMREADGLTRKIAKENMRNLEGAIIENKSAWEGLTIEIGDQFSPTLDAMLREGFTPMLQSLKEGLQGSNSLRIAIANMAIGIIHTIRVILNFANTLRKSWFVQRLLLQVTTSLGTAWELLKLAGRALATILGVLQLSFVALVRSVETVLSTLESGARLLEAWVGVGEGVADRLKTLRERLNEFGDGQQAVADGLFDAAVGADNFKKESEDAFDRVLEGLQGAEDGIKRMRDAMKEGFDPDEQVEKLREDLAALNKEIADLTSSPVDLPAVESARTKLKIIDPAEGRRQVRQLFVAMSEALGDMIPEQILEINKKLSAVREKFFITPSKDELGAQMIALSQSIAKAMEENRPDLVKALREQLNLAVKEMMGGEIPLETPEVPKPTTPTHEETSAVFTKDIREHQKEVFEQARIDMQDFLNYNTIWAQQMQMVQDAMGVSSTAWAKTLRGVYNGLGVAADLLGTVLGKHNRFAKGIRKIQGAILLAHGIASVFQGAIKVAEGIFPPQPPLILSGTKMIVEGTAAIAQAKQMGASGGGAGASTGASAGGGGGGPARQQAILARDATGRQELGTGSASRYIDPRTGATVRAVSASSGGVTVININAVDAASFKTMLESPEYGNAVANAAVERLAKG